MLGMTDTVTTTPNEMTDAGAKLLTPGVKGEKA
jgi:hypothetical protein